PVLALPVAGSTRRPARIRTGWARAARPTARSSRTGRGKARRFMRVETSGERRRSYPSPAVLRGAFSTPRRPAPRNDQAGHVPPLHVQHGAPVRLILMPRSGPGRSLLLVAALAVVPLAGCSDASGQTKGAEPCPKTKYETLYFAVHPKGTV